MPLIMLKAVERGKNEMPEGTRLVHCNQCPFGSVISQAEGSVLKVSK